MPVIKERIVVVGYMIKIVVLPKMKQIILSSYAFSEQARGLGLIDAVNWLGGKSTRPRVVISDRTAKVGGVQGLDRTVNDGISHVVSVVRAKQDFHISAKSGCNRRRLRDARTPYHHRTGGYEGYSLGNA